MEERNQAEGFSLFTFTAHNPQPGALQWKAHQTFADGSMRHWVGERGTKEPASVTTIVPKGGATARLRPIPHISIRNRGTTLIYRWLRDLHLYFGLFISPFILLFAVSVFYLNHGTLVPAPSRTSETYRDLNIPDGFDRLKGREAVERAKAILPQVGVAGEIGFLRYVAKTGHLIFPVSKAGSEATIDVDLDCPHRDGHTPLHGPVGIGVVPPQNARPAQCRASRQLDRHAGVALFADTTIYLLLFVSLSGVYLWWAIKAERRIGMALLAGGAATFAGLVYAVVR